MTTIAGYPSRLAWAGYGRQWLSSGLLGLFASCPYSDMYSFPLLYIGSYVMYLCNLDSLESLLYKCSSEGSFVNSCNDSANSTRIAYMFRHVRRARWAS